MTQIHDLHIWGISTTATSLIGYFVIPQDHLGDKFVTKICHKLHNKFGIAHSTLQIELGDLHTISLLE